MQSHLVEPASTPHRGTGATRHAGVQPPWGGPAPAEPAHLESTRKGPAACAEAARWQGDEADFLHQSHRVAERAACFLMGVTLTTLAMYNLALWLMR